MYTLQHNILYACLADEQRGQDPFVPEHVLSMIVSGTMEVYTDNGIEILAAGMMGICKKNQLLKVVKKPDGEMPFKAISIFLDQTTLRNYSVIHNIKVDEIYTGEANKLLPLDAFMQGYFESLKPYYEQSVTLSETMAKAKTTEAIELLLRNSDLNFFLFDFSEPYKIDLKSYMNKHFTFNISIEKFARLTGRSLSTFKRDFQKIFSSPPEKWLREQRLIKAHTLITEQKLRPSDVYLQVGFENLSHFSFSFKEKFGYNASTI